ncbi:hypothetical protein D3C73_623610 [compost metagenome]
MVPRKTVRCFRCLALLYAVDDKFHFGDSVSVAGGSFHGHIAARLNNLVVQRIVDSGFRIVRMHSVRCGRPDQTIQIDFKIRIAFRGQLRLIAVVGVCRRQSVSKFPGIVHPVMIRIRYC